MGALVWPTGILVALMVSGYTGEIPMPLVMFFACCFVASVVGGAVAMILSMGFDVQHEQTEPEPEPAPNQSDPATKQIPIPNTVTVSLRKVA